MIQWIGGKRRLAKEVIARMPAHTCYVEAFAGGAAVFFARTPAKVEILNDNNGDLVNLYRVVTHHLEEFVRQFKWALSSRQVFQWLKDSRIETLTDIQRAARFFYLQKHCFGGKVDGRSFGTSTTAPVVNLLRIEENLSAAHLRLAGVTIENLHWLDCIKRYDRAHTLFYLDPPYWQTTGYGLPFEWSNYEQLAEAMHGMQGRAILSINDHPDIRACFAGFQTQVVSIKHQVGGATKAVQRNELLICNYVPDNLTPDKKPQ